MYKPPETIGGNYHDGFGYKNSEEYLLQKIAFAQNPHDPADDVDFLILY